MGRIKPNTDPESQAFWDSVRHTAAEVALWPAWKRGGTPMVINCFPDDDGPDLSRFPEKVRGTLRRSLQLPEGAAPKAAPRWEYAFVLWPVPRSMEQWDAFVQKFNTSGEEGWENYDSYPDPTDNGLRVYHFRRQVPA